MRGNLSAQSDPNRDIGRGLTSSVAMRTTFSDADKRQACGQQMQADAARDEYLLNLFRRADQNCTHQMEPTQGQPNRWAGQNAMNRASQQSGLSMANRTPQQSGMQQSVTQQSGMIMGQNDARLMVNLPGYPAHGPLPVHGNPAGAGSQEPHKVDTAGSEGKLANMLDKGPNKEVALEPAKIRAKIGGEAYSAVRDRILEHMEAFVEHIYDLHRLTRRQHHLESICEEKDKYAAELHRLVSPSAEPETAEAENVEPAPEPAAESEKAGKHQKERGNSTERKGSNEPIMPVEELIATALSSESVPEAAKQLSAGPGSAGDRMGSLQAISRGVHCQTSAQDLENQRQNMVAAQEQMKQSMAAAQQARQHSMDMAAQQQHQHHQSMAAAYGQGTASGAPFQAAQDQHAPASQSLRPSNSQRNMISGGLAAGGQHQGGSGNVETGGFSVMPDQQSSQQPVMMSAPEAQSRMPWSNYSPYINPYQSFSNPVNAQGQMGGVGGYGACNQPFYSGLNSFSNSNGQGYGAYNMMGGGGGLSFDPMFAWYAHHYGRGQAQAQAQAQAHAQAQQAADDAQAAEDEDTAAPKIPNAKVPPVSGQDKRATGQRKERPASQAPAVHWWQDPQAAFGEAVPNFEARERENGISNSNSKRVRQASKQTREHEEWAPPKQRLKRQHSTNKANMDEATGQTNGFRTATKGNTLGSGGSAFQKVTQRPRGFRSLQRADSVGSENSRSRSSIGAAPGRRHTDAASPPEQLQSAANILAGLSGQRHS